MNKTLVLLLVPLLHFACGSPVAPPSKSSGTTKGSQNSEVKTETKDTHSGSTPTKPTVVTVEDDEVTTPPQPVTATFLSCGKPSIASLALNIDCVLKNDAGVRVDAATLGKRVVYGVDSTEKEDGVLISTIRPVDNKDYDVRYAVAAADVTKIDKVVDSSTFFVKVYDKDDKEVKGAVKSFLGIDLDIPPKEELLKMFSKGIEFGREILGI